MTENLHGFSMRVLPGECVALLDRSNTILEDIVGLMTGNLRPRSGRLVMADAHFQAATVCASKRSALFRPTRRAQ